VRLEIRLWLQVVVDVLTETARGANPGSPGNHGFHRICDGTRSMHYLPQKRAHKAALKTAVAPS
jgi:hypothetical protein